MAYISQQYDLYFIILNQVIRIKCLFLFNKVKRHIDRGYGPWGNSFGGVTKEKIGYFHFVSTCLSFDAVLHPFPSKGFTILNALNISASVMSRTIFYNVV